jgi:hypothetical protein
MSRIPGRKNRGQVWGEGAKENRFQAPGVGCVGEAMTR